MEMYSNIPYSIHFSAFSIGNFIKEETPELSLKGVAGILIEILVRGWVETLLDVWWKFSTTVYKTEKTLTLISFPILGGNDRNPQIII